MAGVLAHGHVRRKAGVPKILPACLGVTPGEKQSQAGPQPSDKLGHQSATGQSRDHDA